MGIARDIGDKVREGHALHRFGVWAWHREEHLKSQVALESAFELLHEAGLIGEAATCLNDLTMILVSLDEHDAALETAEKAVVLSREVGDTRQEATGLRRLAITFWAQQRHAEALPIAQQALKLHRELGDRGEEVNAINVLGILYAWLKDPEEAETHLRESLELAWSIGDNFGIRAALVNLYEYHYLPRGEYEQWMNFLETQLEKAKESEDELLIGYLELWKVQILSDYGQTKQAMDLLKDLIQGMEKIASKLELVNNYALLSQLQADLGDFSVARRSLKTSLQLSKETGREIMEIYRRYDSAYISLLEGNRERMLIDLEQLLEGLDKIRETNDYVDIVERLNLAARLCLVLGQIEKALKYSSEAIEIMNIIPNFHDPEVTFFAHAGALYGLGRENEAKGYLQQAYDRVMLVANNTKDEKLRQSWLQNVKVNREILEACAERGISR
jgi:tetratricopeptide (TPR) repeat protein